MELNFNLENAKFNQRVWKSEAELQATCTGWFDQTYPDQRGQLILLYNNPPNAIIGAKLITMGLRSGPSDQFYMYGFLKIAYIEYKIGYKTQSEPQKNFQKMVEGFGFEYYLIKNDIEIFKALIKRLNNQ